MSIANEMLQDPAILMTSKNPSITSSLSMSPLEHQPSTSFAHNPNGNSILDTFNANQVSGGAIPKTSKRNAQTSPKVNKKNRSQSKNRQRRSVSDVENVSPQSPHNRRNSRRSKSFKTPSNSNTVDQSKSITTTVTPVMNVKDLPKQSNSVQTNVVPSYKRVYFNNRFNQFEKTHYPTQLNAYARSFIPHPQPVIKPGLSNEYVSQEIMAYHQRNRQSNEHYKSKQILRQGLENTLKQAFPNHFINLYIVGSSTNGIGDNVKSVDICVLSRKRQSAVVESNSSQSESIAQTQTAVANSDDNNSIEIIESNSSQSENEGSDTKETKDIESSPTEPTETTKEKLDESTNDSNEESANTESVKNEEVKVIAAADSVGEMTNSQLTLDKIESVLRGKNFAQNIKVIPAKVPIIKFKDSICNLNVTLNLNQDVSIRNSQLIRDYAKMDWRFPHLAMIMKQWARENRINSAVDKGISSYSWTLMVIHFLQVTEPPVLPCLQKMIPRRYDTRTGIEQAMSIWRRPPTKWQSNNTSNLRQLLKTMFRYYGYVFSYDQHMISVREGKVLDRSQIQTYRSNVSSGDETNYAWNSFLCIEEPFNRTNTTRSVHDKDVFDRIIELFRTSSNALKGNRISLFNIIVDDLEFPFNF